MHWFEEHLLHHYNYWLCILLMGAGLYAVIHSGNLVKKLIGLAILQTSAMLFFISIGYVKGGRFPILVEGAPFYINPLPHVLMLTAIVVGVAVLAVGLALAVRIKESYGTIDEEEVLAIDGRPLRLSVRKDILMAPATLPPQPKKTGGKKTKPKTKAKGPVKTKKKTARAQKPGKKKPVRRRT